MTNRNAIWAPLRKSTPIPISATHACRWMRCSPNINHKWSCSHKTQRALATFKQIRFGCVTVANYQDILFNRLWMIPIFMHISLCLHCDQLRAHTKKASSFLSFPFFAVWGWCLFSVLFSTLVCPNIHSRYYVAIMESMCVLFSVCVCVRAQTSTTMHENVAQLFANASDVESDGFFCMFIA